MKSLRRTFWILGIGLSVAGIGCVTSQAEGDDMVHATETVLAELPPA